MIEKQELVKAIKSGGIGEGDKLNLKVSLKSIGKINGGANTLIEAFLSVIGENGTIISDAFVATQFKNSKDKRIVDQGTPSYAGGLANAMINYPNSFRSRHPIQKFVAIGKDAKKLMENHTKDSFAYGVLKEMVLKHGKNVKIGPESKVPGVGTTHIVLCENGFEQYKLRKGVFYKDELDKINFHEVNWVGGCGFGFNNLMPEFRKKGAVLADVKIGNTSMKVTDFKRTYEIEKNILAKNPESILCSNPDCIDCRLSWSFSDSTYLKFFFQQIFKGNFKKAFGAIYYKMFSHKVKGQENITF